jgi:RNA polymerase sigma factor FliA
MQTASARAATLQDPPFADRETLILKHLPQIKIVALKLCARLHASVDANDLISDGVLGLLDAADKFNPALGVSFRTYAQYRIRGAILDNLRNQDWTPRSMRQKSRKLASTRQSMEMTLGRAPTEEELARAMDLSLEKLYELVEKISGMRMQSLSDQALSEGGGCDRIAPRENASNAEDPFTNLFQSEIRYLLAAAIASLPDRERTVISLHYYEDLTMAGIAESFKLDPSRISQLHSRAIMMLRSKLLASAGCE